jgi:hypothetical protein
METREFSKRLSKTDIRFMLINSFRYALGRQTYVPSEVMAMVLHHIDCLSNEDLVQMAGDIHREAQQDRLGASIDKSAWMNFSNRLHAELINRGVVVCVSVRFLGRGPIRYVMLHDWMTFGHVKRTAMELLELPLDRAHIFELRTVHGTNYGPVLPDSVSVKAYCAQDDTVELMYVDGHWDQYFPQRT